MDQTVHGSTGTSHVHWAWTSTRQPGTCTTRSAWRQSPHCRPASNTNSTSTRCVHRSWSIMNSNYLRNTGHPSMNSGSRTWSAKSSKTNTSWTGGTRNPTVSGERLILYSAWQHPWPRQMKIKLFKILGKHSSNSIGRGTTYRLVKVESFWNQGGLNKDLILDLPLNLVR